MTDIHQDRRVIDGREISSREAADRRGTHPGAAPRLPDEPLPVPQPHHVAEATTKSTRGNDTTDTPSAVFRRSSAAGAGIAATALLALATLIAGLITGGAPNVVAASFALLPLIATTGYLRSARWAPAAAVVTVLTVLMLRLSAISFDLVRPGELVPFAVAVATVLPAGVALASALLVRVDSRREQPVRLRFAVMVAGVLLGALTGVGMVLVSPQFDDTGDLTATEIEALPTIEMINFRFEPGQLRVAAGEPVAFRFNNDTEETHSFAVESLGIDVPVPSGRSRTVVIDVGPGAYPFACTVGEHRDNGMVGQLVVAGDGRTVDYSEPHHDH